jgi:hypothetical protein
MTTRIRNIMAVSGLMLLAAAPASAQEQSGFINDYPTNTRADYVFGCMAVNGQTRDH